jgi:Ni/Fe-hydrogenase b-type cytochrome subunit
MSADHTASIPHVSEFKRVYVWELPVRLYHWINALCILVLTLTGILIAHPPALASTTEASFGYWFGINRFIHFAFAYLFLFNFAFRIYWGFVGNRFADWRNFFPLRRAQFRQVVDVLRVDILQAQDKPIMAVGHNAVKGIMAFQFVGLLGYLCWYAVALAPVACLKNSIIFWIYAPGLILYVLKRPKNPVFGFHEMFHTSVLAGHVASMVLDLRNIVSPCAGLCGL